MPMLLPPNEYINIETREDDADLRIYHSKMRLVDDWAHIEAYKGVIGVDAQTAMRCDLVPGNRAHAPD